MTERSKKSFVWEVFSKIDKEHVQCNKCSSVYKHFGTTNLLTHLKRKHSDIYFKLSGLTELHRKVESTSQESPLSEQMISDTSDSQLFIIEDDRTKTHKVSKWKQSSNNEYMHCRVCLSRTRNYRSIFEPFESAELPPNEMLKLITGVNVNDKLDKNLPRVICKACELSLNMAYNFRVQAIKSDEIINNYRNRNYMNNIVIALDNGKKYKLSKDLTLKVVKKTNEGEIFEAVVEDDADTIIKMEETDDNYIDGQMIQNSDVPEFAEQIEIDPSNPDNFVNCFIKESPDMSRKSDEEESDYWPEDDDYSLNNRLLEDSKSKTDNKPTEVNRTFICEICGVTYRNNTTLAVHLKRHSNAEQPYKCDYCNKGFYLKAGLTRHRMVHSTVKPFKCRLCHRRFYNTNSRKYHELVHTGIRPYVCKVCNKDFLYSWALNKHFITHNVSKLHECECCGLSFRLPQHLKQHNASLKHQTNFQLWNKQTE